MAVGLGLLSDYIRIKRNGYIVKGTVRGLKKVPGDGEGSGGGYMPITDYIYDGKIRTITGITSGTMRYRPGQAVQVLVIANPESGEVRACLKDSANIFLSLGFVFGGLAAIGFYLFSENPDKMMAAFAMAVAVLAGLVVPKFMQTDVATRDTSFTDDGSKDFIDTAEKFLSEHKRHNFLMYGLNGLCLIAGIGLLIAAYIYLSGPNFSAAEIQSTFSSIDGIYQRLTSDRLDEKWTQGLVMLGAGIMFTLTSISTMISQWLKSRAF